MSEDVVLFILSVHMYLFFQKSRGRNIILINMPF